MKRFLQVVAVFAWSIAAVSAGDGRDVDPARIAKLLEDVRSGIYRALYNPAVKDPITSMYKVGSINHAVLDKTRGYLFDAVLGDKLGAESDSRNGAVAGLVGGIARQAGNNAALALFKDYLENPQAVAKSIANATISDGLDAYDTNLRLVQRIGTGRKLVGDEKRRFAENHVKVGLLGAAKELHEQSLLNRASPYHRKDAARALAEIEAALSEWGGESEFVLISSIVDALNDAELPAPGYRPLRQFFATASQRTRDVIGLVVVSPVVVEQETELEKTEPMEPESQEPLQPVRPSSTSGESVVSIPELEVEATVDKEVSTGPDTGLLFDTLPATEELRRKKLTSLLGRQISAEQKDRNGWTDLHYAAYLNLPSAIDGIVAQGGTVDARIARDGLLLEGNVVRTLDAFGAHASKWRRDGRAPLHYAAMGNAVDAADRLIAHGASIDLRDGMNNTPLHVAAISGSHEIVRLLIVNGADTKARGESGNTAVHFAAQSDAPKVLDVLLGWSTYKRINCTDKPGGRLDCVKVIWKYFVKGESNVKNDDRKTPLDLARERGAGSRTLDIFFEMSPSEKAMPEGR